MPVFLKTIGWISIIGGFIVGSIAGFRNDPIYQILGVDADFRFATTLTWWIGGLFSGVAYIALGMIVEQQEEMSRTVCAVLRNVREQSTLNNSSLAKDKDFKLRSFA